MTIQTRSARPTWGLVFLVELDYGEVRPCEDGLVAAGFEHPADLRAPPSPVRKLVPTPFEPEQCSVLALL